MDEGPKDIRKSLLNNLLMSNLNQKQSDGYSQANQNRVFDFNSILIYNIATMCYQTQNYGQAILYLKIIIENLDQVEEFIQVKSLFLCLQVMFELRMKYAAQPIIDLLEVKLYEIERLIEQKK